MMSPDDDWIAVLQRKIDRLSPTQRKKRADKLARKMVTHELVSVPQMAEIVALCNPVSVRDAAEQIREGIQRGELGTPTMVH